MSRLTDVAVAIAITATVLAGCSGSNKASGPKSGLLPAVELPVDSHQFQSKDLEGGGEIESWDVPLSYTETRDLIAAELPIGRTFDNSPYEGEESGIDKSGNERTEWTWKSESAAIFVLVSEDPTKEDHARVHLGSFSS